jgi:hypothetical protein
LQPFGSLKAFFATDKKRPDGMTTFPYKALQGGITIGVGFHCSRYCVQPTVTHQLKNLAKTAENAELRKIHDYRHLTDFHFIPGAEIPGPFGPHAVQFLEDLGNKISNINGDSGS